MQVFQVKQARIAIKSWEFLPFSKLKFCTRTSRKFVQNRTFWTEFELDHTPNDLSQVIAILDPQITRKQGLIDLKSRLNSGGFKLDRGGGLLQITPEFVWATGHGAAGTGDTWWCTAGCWILQVASWTPCRLGFQGEDRTLSSCAPLPSLNYGASFTSSLKKTWVSPSCAALLCSTLWLPYIGLTQVILVEVGIHCDHKIDWSKINREPLDFRSPNSLKLSVIFSQVEIKFQLKSLSKIRLF